MNYYFPSDPDYRLWAIIRRAHEAIYSVRKSEISPFKLSTAETGVLLIVHQAKGKMWPSEISRQLMKKPNFISQLLGRMEKRGLIRTTKELTRKNRIQVKLTEKGLEAHKLAESGEKLHKIMGVLTEEERDQLIHCLTKLTNEALKEIH